jgi:hypothetical protein
MSLGRSKSGYTFSILAATLCLGATSLSAWSAGPTALARTREELCKNLVDLSPATLILKNAGVLPVTGSGSIYTSLEATLSKQKAADCKNSDHNSFAIKKDLTFRCGEICKRLAQSEAKECSLVCNLHDLILDERIETSLSVGSRFEIAFDKNQKALGTCKANTSAGVPGAYSNDAKNTPESPRTPPVSHVPAGVAEVIDKPSPL